MSNKSSDRKKYSGMISKKEIIDLAKKKDAGDFKAREKLIVSHLWCVEKFVSYHISTLGTEVDMQELYKDLYQEGCYGLIQAVDRYDWRRDVYLSTYAQKYIRKYVLKYFVDKIPYIRLPERMYYMSYKYMTFVTEFMGQYNRRPTVEESAQALHVTEKTIKTLLKYYRLLFTKQDENDTFVSFDDAISGEYIKTAEEIIQEIVPLDLKDFNIKLKPREVEVIEKYLGLAGNEPKKFKQIGEELGISDEMARRAYHSGIEKMRKALGIYEEK